MTSVRPFAAAAPATVRRPPWLGAGTPPAVVPLFQPQQQQSVGADPQVLRQQQLERELEAAFIEAAEQGRAQGEAEGLSTYQQAVERLESVVADLLEMPARIYQQTEQQLVELSVSIAKGILGRELADDTDYVLQAVKEALQLLAEAAEIEIRVSAADHDVVNESCAKLVAAAPHGSKLRVRADERIEAGCRVESQVASIDATLNGRLKNVLGAMRRGVEQ